VTVVPLNARRCSDLPCVAEVACRLARGVRKRCRSRVRCDHGERADWAGRSRIASPSSSKAAPTVACLPAR